MSVIIVGKGGNKITVSPRLGAMCERIIRQAVSRPVPYVVEDADGLLARRHTEPASALLEVEPKAVGWPEEEHGIDGRHVEPFAE